MSLTVTRLRSEGTWALLNEVVYGDRIMFRARLMPVYEHERELADGRFKLYRPDKQDYVVCLRRDRITDGITNTWFCEWINWIADHASAAWSIDLEHLCIGNVIAHFSFASSHDAVMFKLVWDK